MATLGERLVEAIGGITRTEFDTAVQRATEAGYAAGYNDGNDEPNDGTGQRFGYRSMAKGLRDFGKATTGQLMQTAWSLWQSSPVAKRIMTLKRDHIAGRNVNPMVTGDEDAAELINEFWLDNKLDRRAGEFALQLFLLGEQCYPAFVRKSDGRVRLGYIDPEQIADVVCHPHNSMEMWAVVVGDATVKQDARIYRIIRPDEGAVNEAGEVTPSKNEGRLVTWEQATLEPWEEELTRGFKGGTYSGSVFWTGVNRLSNQKRGVSDLIQVADWIDQADETLFALGDREQYADFFSYDITITGAGQEQIAKRTAEIRKNPPKKGSFNVHNEAETWELQYPELRQEGSIATYRAILGLILGGVGFPVHWFGYGDDANRATALAQGDPTLKSLEYDQSTVRDMLTQVLQFVIDQAEIAGNSFDDELEIAVQLPELDTKDLARIIPLFGPFAIALMSAVEAGYMAQETAAKAWAKLMAEFGIEIDPETELETIAAEALEDEQQRNDDLAGRMASVANEPDGRLTSGDIEPEQVLNGSA